MGGVPEGWAEPVQAMFGWSFADAGINKDADGWLGSDMWILDTTGSPEYTIPTTPGGVIGWIEALSQDIPTSYSNPYAASEVYDPFEAGEPLLNFKDYLDGLTQDLTEYVTFEERWTQVKDLIEEDLTEEYEQLAQEYATAHEREMNASYGRIARTFASFNAINQTGLMRAAMELELAHSNMVAQKELELKLAGKERELTFLPTLIENMNRDRAIRLDAARIYLAYSELWMTNKRSYFEEGINLAIQDDLWTLNLYDYSTKMMSGFNGAPVLETQGPKWLSALSQGANIAAAATTPITALVKWLG